MSEEKKSERVFLDERNNIVENREDAVFEVYHEFDEDGNVIHEAYGFIEK